METESRIQKRKKILKKRKQLPRRKGGGITSEYGIQIHTVPGIKQTNKDLLIAQPTVASAHDPYSHLSLYDCVDYPRATLSAPT